MTRAPAWPQQAGRGEKGRPVLAPRTRLGPLRVADAAGGSSTTVLGGQPVPAEQADPGRRAS